MSLLAIFSTTAIVVGLAAVIPQLATMVRARSAAGQSALGWSLGAFVNTLMAYVNFAGYHATVLALGNVLSVALCLAALGLVFRYGDAASARVAEAGVDGLPTSEFWALREALEHEARRRDPHAFATA
jgi:hypothetical protein